MADMMPAAGPDPMTQISAMLSAAGVRPTTENLNRAMLAIAQQRQPDAGDFLQGGENEQTEAGSIDNEQVEGGGGGGVATARRGGARPAASRPGMPAWDGAQYDPGSVGMGAAIGGMPQQSAAMLPQQMPMDTELPVAINHANEYNNMPQGAAPGMMPAVEAALGSGMPAPMASANMNGPMDRREAAAPVSAPQGPRTLSDMRDARGNPLIMDPRAMVSMASPMKLMQASELLANLAQRAARQGVAAMPQGAEAAAAAMPMRSPGGSGVIGAGLKPTPNVSMPGRVSKVTPRDAIKARQRQQNPTAAAAD